MPQCSGKVDNFVIFGTNLPKNYFWGRNFENPSPDLESPPPSYHVRQFLGKTDNFEFFDQNLGKLPDYVWCSGSYNVEGLVKSWVEAEMSWVEVGGARWRWLHGLAIPFSNTEMVARFSNTVSKEALKPSPFFDDYKALNHLKSPGIFDRREVIWICTYTPLIFHLSPLIELREYLYDSNKINLFRFFPIKAKKFLSRIIQQTDGTFTISLITAEVFPL